jgi:hypothetical protein
MAQLFETMGLRMRILGERVKRTRLIQTEKYVVSVEVEMVFPVDDPSEPCYEAETVRLLREIRERAERGRGMVDAQGEGIRGGRGDMTILCPNTRSDVITISEQCRAIAFISVDWSAYERHSRPVFRDLVGQLTARYPRLGVSFWILRADWEGMDDWFAACKPPVQAATGYGAVVWIENGKVIATEEYAARAGVDGLVERTLQLWQST